MWNLITGNAKPEKLQSEGIQNAEGCHRFKWWTGKKTKKWFRKKVSASWYLFIDFFLFRLTLLLFLSCLKFFYWHFSPFFINKFRSSTSDIYSIYWFERIEWASVVLIETKSKHLTHWPGPSPILGWNKQKDRRVHQPTAKKRLFQNTHTQKYGKFNKIWNLIQKPCSILITIIIIVKKIQSRKRIECHL